eukprot:1159478-Pelagomonas_calceolata.AAC.12
MGELRKDNSSEGLSTHACKSMESHGIARKFHAWQSARQKVKSTCAWPVVMSGELGMSWISRQAGFGAVKCGKKEVS